MNLHSTGCKHANSAFTIALFLLSNPQSIILQKIVCYFEKPIVLNQNYSCSRCHLFFNHRNLKQFPFFYYIFSLLTSCKYDFIHKILFLKLTRPGNLYNFIFFYLYYLIQSFMELRNGLRKAFTT